MMKVRNIKISVQAKTVLKFLDFKAYKEYGYNTLKEWFPCKTGRFIDLICKNRYKYITDITKRYGHSFYIDEETEEKIKHCIQNPDVPINYRSHLFELIIYLLADEWLNEEEKSISTFNEWNVDYK